MIRLAPASGLHAVTFQLAVKRGDADAQQPRRLGLVAAGVLQNLRDMPPLHVAQRHGIVRIAALRTPEIGGKVPGRKAAVSE